MEIVGPVGFNIYFTNTALSLFDELCVQLFDHVSTPEGNVSLTH